MLRSFFSTTAEYVQLSRSAILTPSPASRIIPYLRFSISPLRSLIASKSCLPHDLEVGVFCQTLSPAVFLYLPHAFQHSLCRVDSLTVELTLLEDASSGMLLLKRAAAGAAAAVIASSLGRIEDEVGSCAAAAELACCCCGCIISWSCS